MGGDDLELHASAVCGGRDNSAQGLIEYGTNVDHSQTRLSEGTMQAAEDDSTLVGNGITLFYIDLPRGATRRLDHVKQEWNR